MADTTTTTAGVPAPVTGEGNAAAPAETAGALVSGEAAIAAFFEDAPAQPAGETEELTEPPAPEAEAEPAPATPEDGEAGDTAENTENTDPEPDAEAESAGEPGAAASADFSLPQWAAELPEEAQTQVREMGAGFLARIRKHKEQRDEARETAEEARAELAQVREKANAVLQGPTPLARTDADPLSELTTAEAVDARAADARKTLEFLEERTDGFESKRKDGTVVEYSAEEVRGMIRNCRRVIDAAPARKEYLRQQTAADAVARQAYPELFQDGSGYHKAAAEVLQDNPEMIRRYDYKIALGDEIVGRLVRRGVYKLVKADSAPAKKAAAPAPATAKPATAKPAAPLSASASAPATRPTGTKPDLEALRQAKAQGDMRASEALEDAFFE